MHRRIAPALVVEATLLVQVPEYVPVCPGGEKIHVGNLKVGPKVAHVPTVAGWASVGHPEEDAPQRPWEPGRIQHGRPQGCGLNGVAVFVAGELVKERGHGFADFPESDGVAVALVIALHLDKRVVGDGASKRNPRLNAPIPFVVAQGIVIVEEATTVLRQCPCFGGVLQVWRTPS